MFKALLSTRLRSLFYGMFKGARNSKKRGAGFAVLIAILAIYVVCVWFVMFGMLFDSICEPFTELGLSWFYFATAFLFAFALCFIGSVFAVKSQIFEANDNELLLSMPVPPFYILMSRLAALLLLNYLYEMFIVLPAIVVWCLHFPVTFTLILFFIICVLLLPLLSLAVSCLFAWVLALISTKMRNKNVITLIFSLAFLCAYIYVYSHISSYINKLVDNGTEIAAAIQKAIFPAYHFGNAIANGSAVSLILFILCAVIPFAIACFLLSRSFIKIATSNKGLKKKRYVEQELKTSGVRTAFFKKEMRHFLSNPMYILNAALGCFFMIVAAIFLAVKKADVAEFAAQTPEMSRYLGLLGALAVTFCAATVVISAPSISLEGNNLWIAKSLPVKPFDVLLSKVMTHFAATMPFVIVAGIVCVAVTGGTPLQVLVTFLLPAAFTAFSAAFGVAVNLKFPKFDWISETHAVKQSVSVLICMFGAIGIVILFFVLYVAVFAAMMSLTAYLLLCSALFIILAALLMRYLATAGSRQFEAL